MSEDVSNINLFAIEMNGGNEPIFIAADIEYHETIYIIGTGEVLFEVVEGVIVGLLDNSIPIFEWRLAIRIFGDKFFDMFMGDDVHIILYLVLR